MYLTMKIGNAVVDQKFISRRNMYEEGYVQTVIKQLIEANEQAMKYSDEQAVFTLEEHNPTNRTTAKKPLPASLNQLLSFFGKGV